MEFISTKFKDAWIIKPRVFSDQRGFFLESYSKKIFSEHGIESVFVQDNHSMSFPKGVLRGLHYQKPPRTQAKLVRVTRGSVYDVILDLRKNSDTFGQWQGFKLSAENFEMLFIPKGFAHGFLTLENDTEFMYKCDEFYAPESEGGIIWNDPALKIDWPFGDPVLSEKDQNHPQFKDISTPF